MYAEMPRKGQRLVALFLLLWAFADLGVQGICQTDGTLPLPQASAGLSASSESSGQRQATRIDDDCFCCCSHIFFSPHFELSVPLVEQQELSLFLGREPEIYLATPSLPPRS